jgi:aldose 1-epimerase
VSEIIELRAGPSRVVVAPAIGGSIATFEYEGQPILRPTPEQAIAEGTVRNFACFPLIPFSNRIADAKLRWGTREYALTRYVDGERNAIHGNGWQRAWSVVQREPSGLTIELEHDGSGARAQEWPFPYRGRQRLDLAVKALAVKLTLELRIENTGNEAFPFGLGWHPYFNRDLQTELGFSAAGVWQTDPVRLPTRLDPVPPQWNFHPPRPVGATVLDNCFAGWRSPATVRWPARKLAADIAASPACSFLVVFVPADEGPGEAQPFFALEPVTHMTDAFNHADKNRDTGTRVLAPGASFSCTMSISVSPNG